jgi:hypothetical protein
MKSGGYFHPKKHWLYIAAVSYCLAGAGETKAQNQLGSGLVGAARLYPDSQNNIVSFSPVFADGKTYVRWLVQNDEKDGLFIVERSADGIEFEALGYKDRVGSPLCVNLFYALTDESPFPGTTWYRIMAVSTDQTYSYSAVVKVTTNPRLSNGSPNSVLGN